MPSRKVAITEQYLIDIANAIRIKKESEAPIATTEMAQDILSIITSSGAFKVSSVNEMNAITTMRDNDICIINTELQDTYQVFKYLNSTWTDITDEILEVTKTVTPSTSQQTITPSQGYDGMQQVIVEAILTETKTINPSTSSQTVNPTSGKFISEVTVPAVTSSIDANIVPSKIKKGITILGTTGTYKTDAFKVSSVQEMNALTDMEVGDYCVITGGSVPYLVYQYMENSGWVDVTDDILVPQTTITPTTSTQTPTIPQGYKGFKNITINAVTSEIDANILPENIKLGVSILGVAGNVEPDKPDQSKTVDPSISSQTIRPDTGYELASVTINAVTAAIDNNIVASNIKKGVTILGVTGTYEGVVPEEEYEYQLETAKDIAGIEEGGGE